jgi:hypothetical protein
MKLTEEEFIEAAHGVATAVLAFASSRRIDPDDLANVAGGALAEVIGQALGSPFKVVERLRDIADRIEAAELGTHQKH